MSRRIPRISRDAHRHRRWNHVPLLEPVEPRLLLSIYTVENTNDSGPGSLRDAINQVNKGTVDTIDFDLPGTGPFIIAPNSPLPLITRTVLLDATTQPGFNPQSAAPVIEIDGSAHSLSGDGLTLAPGSDMSTITGLCISGFSSGAGIHIESNNNQFYTDYIGTDITGTRSQPNQTGIEVANASNNVIGASDSTEIEGSGKAVLHDGNLISGNASNGVWLTGDSSQNVLEGNFIGTDVTGTAALANSIGVQVDSGASANFIGGENEFNPDKRITFLAGNLISGNGGSGIVIEGTGTSTNVIEGNLVGLDSSGSTALGNFNGVTVQDGATSNTIGGLTPATRNIISASTQTGVAIAGEGTDQNTVEGNYIGTDYSGTFSLSNYTGVLLSNGAQFNTIGAANLLNDGTVDVQNNGLLGNLISGNSKIGIDLEGTTTAFNIVAGNFVGTDRTGTRAVPNDIGIQIGTGANQNTIGVGQGAGNPGSALANIVSGNLDDGVLIAGRQPLNFADGFQSVGGQLITNGEARFQGTQLALTNGGAFEASSVFSSSQIDITQFTTNFSFQIIPAPGMDSSQEADGFTFCIQAIGPTALGSSGGYLGYAGISKSIAVKFDLYNNAGEGTDSTGLYQNGAAPFVPAIDLSSSGIDLHSGHTFDVSMSYEGETLGVTITDTVTNVSTVESYTVNIPSIVGGTYAYVGFTAGTGALTSDQTINGWTFTPLPMGTSLGNVVAGNLIGTDLTGTSSLGNRTGVLITAGAQNNTIGGTFATRGNLISGNQGTGVALEGAGTSYNVVLGNRIGTDLSATNSVANPTGVLIGSGASQNTIGGPNVVSADGTISTLRGNIISGNLNEGVHIEGIKALNYPYNTLNNTSGNTLEGNLIGPNINLLPQGDPEGNRFLSNSIGVLIDNGATSNSVDLGNVIGCNSTAGIEIRGFQTTLNAVPEFFNTSQNVVAGSFIGTDPSGLLFLGNQIGVLIDDDAANNTVGGSRATGNVISSNLGPGVDIRGNNAVQTVQNEVSGNYIGTDATGEHVANPHPGRGLYNPIGILLEAGASNNTVGGSNALSPGGTPVLSQGNLISGNPGAGVEISGVGSNKQTENNVIEGNFIGTDASGETRFDSTIPGYPLGNGTGVMIVAGQGGAIKNTIGGTTAGTRNVISGNLVSGVEINSSGGYVPASQNLIVGNYIGTDVSGTKTGMGNVIGVLIDSGAYENTVGGTVTSAMNLISGNATGVDISGASGNQVEGNLIGTDATGESALPNTVAGVTIEGASSRNTIGGSDLSGGERNVISGNTGAGVVINGTGATYNVLEGNYVGTGLDGESRVPNGIGVLIVAGAYGNTVGGTTDSASESRNIISGNTGSGVEILGFQSSSSASAYGNCIEGNYIGTDSSGTFAVQNSVGVLLSNAPNNTIGSTNVVARNVISGNASIGVEILGLGSKNECLMGNFIGPDASGDNALPGSALRDPTKAVQQTGILVDGAIGNYIGESGTLVNVISGNVVGIEFTAIGAIPVGPTNTVTANYIGIGNSRNSLGNVIGVWVNDVSQTQIGLPDAGNIISGNSESGIYIIGIDASANLVQGNIIGLGPQGQNYDEATRNESTNPFPIGVYIQNSSSNTIGGGGSGDGNTISGNNVGVYIFGTGGSSTNNQILGNSIGLPISGDSRPPGNVLYGVMLYNAPYNTVAQTGPSANKFADNRIANYREFSGAVATTTQTGSRKASGSNTKKPAHHAKPVAHQSPRRTVHHGSITVHGRSVPSGPLRKARGRALR